MCTTSHNRLYIVTQEGLLSFIHEITPSTAAGVGSGRVVGIIPAQVAAAEWSSGLLYMVIKEYLPGGTPRILLAYFDPVNETYGIVAPLENTSTDINDFCFDKGDGLTTLLLATKTPEGKHAVKIIDLVSGTTHPFALDGGATDASGEPVAITRLDEYMILLSNTGTAYAWDMDLHAGNSAHDDPYIISPLWDFGIVDQKVLSSVRVESEEIPTDWTVTVAYQLDDDGSWVDIGTLDAHGS